MAPWQPDRLSTDFQLCAFIKEINKGLPSVGTIHRDKRTAFGKRESQFSSSTLKNREITICVTRSSESSQQSQEQKWNILFIQLLDEDCGGNTYLCSTEAAFRLQSYLNCILILPNQPVRGDISQHCCQWNTSTANYQYLYHPPFTRYTSKRKEETVASQG